MGAVGADVGALRSYARSLQQRAHIIEGELAQLDLVIQSLPWAGTDRARFLDEWQQIHQRNLLRLVLDLRSASTQCSRHADQQEAASAAGGAPW